MPILTKEQILAPVRRYAVVTVPELGGEVRLVSPGARAAIRCGKLLVRQQAGENILEELSELVVSTGFVDPEGKPLFTAESAAEAVDKLSEESVALLVAEWLKLANPAPKPDAVPPGNSEASPSAA